MTHYETASCERKWGVLWAKRLIKISSVKMWWIGFLLLPSASLPAGGFIFHTPFSFSMPLPLTNEMRAKVMIVTSTKVLKISVQSTVYIFSFWHDQIELPLQSGSQDKNNLEQSCSQPANDMYHEQEIDLCYAIHWDLGGICFYYMIPLTLTDAKNFICQSRTQI